MSLQGELDCGTGSPTIRGFFVQQSQSTSLSGFTLGALRVKASALYEGANRLSSSWSPRTSLPILRVDHRTAPLTAPSPAPAPASVPHTLPRQTGSLASTVFSDNFTAFEHSIVRFTTTLLPLHQVGGAIPDDKFALLAIHSLAHAAMIALHAPFMRDDAVSRDKCLRAARAVIHVTKLIADADVDFLDPVIGVRVFFPVSFCFMVER